MFIINKVVKIVVFCFWWGWLVFFYSLGKKTNYERAPVCKRCVSANKPNKTNEKKNDQKKLRREGKNKLSPL